MMTPSKLEDIEHAIEKAAAGWRPCHVTRRTSAKAFPKKALKVHVWQENATPAVPSRSPRIFFDPPRALLGRVLINRDW